MKRPTAGRGLFCTRDSGGKHETTPAEYVRWACGKAQELHLSFDGTPEAINAMISAGESHRGDLFLDFDVAGEILSRPGLNRLLAEVKNDPTVSHVMIPRRDRLARPEDPLDAMVLEASIRRAGVTVVFMDRTLPPLTQSSGHKFEDLIMGLIDYERAEKEVSDLGKKMVLSQIALARAGYSIGGRPPYGFRRWLVKTDGATVRQLEEGERVRQHGHHVVWLPVPDEHPEMIIIRRILDMLVKVPASRVAATLTAEGIPSPDAGRRRTDNKIPHQVSGVWHQSTIINIARNRLLVAVCSAGRRSMGKKFRYTPDGPRELETGDFRPDGKPKVIQNPESSLMIAAGRFEPIIPVDQHQDLQAILDQRASTQRGKPRSRDPSMNPLGGRAFDMNCGWSLYRVPSNGSFKYSCGFYMQSHGAECSHNHVDGPTATRFIQACMMQRLHTPTAMAKLEAKLRQLAEQERVEPGSNADAKTSQAALERVEKDLSKASRNLALAETEEDYRAIAAVCRELRKEKSILEEKIASLRPTARPTSNIETEVEAALSVVARLPDMVADASQLAMIGDAFTIADVKLFIAFSPTQLKKRTVNKVSHGVVNFGAVPPPIPLYRGPTGRRARQLSSAATVAAGLEGDVTLPGRGDDGREGKSLGNVNRGDRI